MKTVNIRQSRMEFINEYMRVVENAYFTAFKHAFELTKGKSWEKINFTYDNKDLTYLSVINEAGNEIVIFERS